MSKEFFNVRYITEKHNTNELRLRSLVSQAMWYCDNLNTLENAVKEAIKSAKRNNHVALEYAYALERKNNCLIIHHKNIAGDIDRTVMEITIKTVAA